MNFYPFDANNISSDNSKNQFMINESSISMSAAMMNTNSNVSPPQLQKIFSYMKNVFSNPSMMDKMEKFMATKQAEKNSSFLNNNSQSFTVSRIEQQLRPQPNSYLIQPSPHYKPQPLRLENKQSAKRVKNPQSSSGQTNRKKGTDIFSTYVNHEQNGNDLHHQSKMEEKPIQNLQKKQYLQSQKPISFQDMPIQSNYIASKQFTGVQSLAETSSNKIEQKKISRRDKIPASKPSISFSKSNSDINSTKYLQSEQRPLNGTKKDFKQLLMQKFENSPFDNMPLPTSMLQSDTLIRENLNYKERNNEYNSQEIYEQQHSKPKRQFLKRGSRQYLSSAKDKNAQKNSGQAVKPNPDKLNTSRACVQNTETDKTPLKRDFSQNRVLSKRNTSNNDNSIPKKKSKQQINTAKNQSFYEQKQQQSQTRTIVLRNQRPAINGKSLNLPPKNNKRKSQNSINANVSNSGNGGSGKKKNIFKDSSSQSNDQGHQQKGLDDLKKQQNYQRDNRFTAKNGSKNQKKTSYRPQQQFDMFNRQKKQQVIEGVYLTRSQLSTILLMNGSIQQKTMASSKSLNNSQQKFNELRKKYTDLCNLLQKQKNQHEEQMDKQRQQFQIYKQQETQRIKAQKRVMQRQIKSSMPSQGQNLQKDREQVQILKKQLENVKEEHKKKDKNHKILIEKYKKQTEEMKHRIQKLQEQLQKASSVSPHNNFCSAASERQHNIPNQRLSHTANEKSKPKLITKNVSPVKNKITRNANTINGQHQSGDQALNDMNYKKTVPFNKNIQQQQKHTNNDSKDKKKYEGKHFDQPDSSDDDNLPKFSVEDKNKEKSNVKTHTIYHFVENSVHTNLKAKNATMLAHQKTDIKSINSRSVVANGFTDNDQKQSLDNQSYDQNQDSYNQQTNGGFFRQAHQFQKLSDLVSEQFSVKKVTPQLINSLFRWQNNFEYIKYLQKIQNPKRIILNSSKNGVDRKITNIYNDKSKQVLFDNGVKKQIFQDGYTIIYFKNGDIKQKLTDGTLLYFFKQKQVDQITLVNGTNIFRFQNNQVELHYDAGKYIEIRNPDGTIKMLGSAVN